MPSQPAFVGLIGTEEAAPTDARGDPRYFLWVVGGQGALSELEVTEEAAPTDARDDPRCFLWVVGGQGEQAGMVDLPRGPQPVLSRASRAIFARNVPLTFSLSSSAFRFRSSSSFARSSSLFEAACETAAAASGSAAPPFAGASTKSNTSASVFFLAFSSQGLQPDGFRGHSIERCASLQNSHLCTRP